MMQQEQAISLHSQYHSPHRSRTRPSDCPQSHHNTTNITL
jgi:hypothetical protein